MGRVVVGARPREARARRAGWWNPDLIEDGVNGSSPGDTEALAEALVELTDRGLVERLAGAGFRASALP
jgi:hypothetical protein